MSAIDDSICDPISMEIMVDAMSLPCGHSFAKTTIEEWLATHNTCPLCNAALTLADIRPNFGLRAVIDAVAAVRSSAAAAADVAAAPAAPAPAVAEAPVAVAAASSSSPAVVAPIAVDPWLDSVTVLRVQKSDAALIERVANLLATSFIHSDDVFVGYCWPDRSPTAVGWFFAMICDYCSREGRIFAVCDGGGRLIGAALWQHPQLPGESGVSIFSMLKSGLALAPFVIGIRSTARVLKSLGSTERSHIDAMGDAPHWSLYTLAVLPDVRSRGAGSKLMRPVLDAADRANMSAYVDTATPRTEAFFTRLGFDTKARLQGLKDGVPPFTVMVRPPAAASPPS